MFTQQYHLAALDEKETQRLFEVLFYLFVTRLLKTSKPFNISIEFIFSCAAYFNCNITILNRVVLQILNNNILYKPNKIETIVLMHKAQIPIRDIVSTLDISNFTVYKYINEYITKPFTFELRHEKNEYIEMRKFLIEFNKLKGII